MGYRKNYKIIKRSKEIDNFSQKNSLENNNETNKQERNISLNPKKNLCMEMPSKQNSD